MTRAPPDRIVRGMRSLRLAGILAALLLLASGAAAQDAEILGTERHPLEPPDTSSPRATYESFLQDANAAWRAYLGAQGQRRGVDSPAARHVRRAARTLDLSEQPPAHADDVGVSSVILLLDVMNRVPIPPPSRVPDAAAMEKEGQTRWTLPHTAISIGLVKEGPRKGEWLFTPQTVAQARDFYRLTRDLPLKPGAVIEDGYRIFVALPGWMIPVAWVEALPAWAQEIYLGQTAWQWALLLLIVVPAAALGVWVIRWSRRGRAGARPAAWRILAGPAALVLLAGAVGHLVRYQLGLTGPIYAAVDTVSSSILIIAAAWTALILGGVAASAIVASPHIRPGSLDENIVRLVLRVLSFAVAVFILLEGARQLGLSVVGLLAGLGVGGLAVALAAQSTIENFIGSLTLYADRPVRVGDFCRFGDQVGTVEEIGLRSTRIRTLERSLLTVPNAEFSRLKLDNLTKRDRILFRTLLNLRLETSSDQLRLVLARLRELLLGHPRIDAEPARVRLAAVGPASLDLEVFAYARTSDWNEFVAIREDLLLRMMEVVEEAGTSFAPPARTTYVVAGRGVDAERIRSAEAEVERWRREEALPFPEFSAEQREKLADTLDYPPAGSPRPAPSAGQKT